MAKIVVYSMAYRGDVFPFVPIATELARRGHEVTFVVPSEFHPSFAAEPFRSVDSGTDFSPSALDEHAAYVARWGMRFGGGLLLRLYFGVFTIPHLVQLFEAIDSALEGADLLVSHPAASIVGSMSCERRGLPWIVGDLFPMLVPTATAPPAGLPNLGPRANEALWRAARSKLVARLSYEREFSQFRAYLGLATDRVSPIDARLSPHLNLGLASSLYVAPLPDWPSNYRLTGFTDWTGPDAGRLPEDVVEFLDAGEPPVVVTLGTSAASARPEMFEAAARALDELGLRGLFLTSNTVIAGALRAAGASQAHGIWPFAPLASILPRARAIVHAGAHGTNALALSHGLPSVIVPCLFDQRWHAERQAQLGTGVWVRRPRQLAAAIDHATTDPDIARRSRDLGRGLREEDGTGAACDNIEAFLAAR